MEKSSFKIKVTEDYKGQRLDKFLVNELSSRFSRSFIQRLISGKHILLDGNPVKSHHRVNAGELVEINIPEAKESSIKVEEIPLDIVYEDEYLLVVNKPAGMVVHPAPGNYSGTLVNAILWHCASLSGIGGRLKPGIVHRIDKGTSGLLVVAKTDEAHNGLARQFKDRTINRIYIALVKGTVQLDNGIIELPIGRSVRDRKKMAVKFEKSKTAKTSYRVLKRFEDFTVLELKLATGRTHQIRVHLSYIGHPLLGDEKYGTKGILARPALHAATLGFIHPITKKYLEFTSELPKDLNEIISRGHF